MYDVTALGELLIDFVCKSSDIAGYPTLAANPGGAPGNFLAALSAYGCQTAFLGKVGEDVFGNLLIHTLQKSGIDTKGVVQDASVFTTMAFVTLDSSGNRSFDFARKPGADTQLSFEELDLSLIDACRDFHFGTLSLTCDPVRTATQKAVAYAKQQGKLISFDPNLRKPLWRDQEEAREQILWGLRQADIVKISEEETEFLWDCSPKQAAERLHEEYGVQIVFITLGPKGCFYSGNGFTGLVEAPTEVHTVDTTGAGDIFGGSVMSRLLAMHKPLNQFLDQELHDATKFACFAASASTCHLGGISSVQPLDEVISLMRAYG